MAAQSQRMHGVDAARGTAMLFVCLSHFGLEYFNGAGTTYDRLRDLLYMIGMVASPTFVAISGAMLGIFHAARRADFARFSASLLGRGLFLLTVAHALIVIACIPREGSLSAAAQLGFMTDAVGFAVILGPIVVARVSAYGRAAIGAALVTASWLLTAWWWPESATGEVVKHVLSGPFPHRFPNVFPLLPWFGVYIAASAVGSWIAGPERGKELRAGAQWCLLALGAGAVAAAVAIKGAVWAAARAGMLDADGTSLLFVVT